MGNKKVLYVILAVICLSLTACAGAGVMYSLMSANRSELNSSSIDGNKLQLKNETSIAKVASDVAPSVVSIRSLVLVYRQSKGLVLVLLLVKMAMLLLISML